MTTIRRDGQDTPFSDWIRRHPALDSIKERICVSDVDMWIHQYRAHSDRVGARAVDSIMCLEVKTHSADLSFAQRDTLTLVHQLLCATDLHFRRTGKPRIYRRLVGPGREKRIVRCFGVIPFLMSGTHPDDSDTMLWRGILIDQQMLVELLNFERDPHAPNCWLPGPRRHHTPSSLQQHPFLPGLELVAGNDVA